MPPACGLISAFAVCLCVSKFTLNMSICLFQSLICFISQLSGNEAEEELPTRSSFAKSLAHGYHDLPNAEIIQIKSSTSF